SREDAVGQGQVRGRARVEVEDGGAGERRLVCGERRVADRHVDFGTRPAVDEDRAAVTRLADVPKEVRAGNVQSNDPGRIKILARDVDSAAGELVLDAGPLQDRLLVTPERRVGNVDVQVSPIEGEPRDAAEPVLEDGALRHHHGGRAGAVALRSDAAQ